MEALEDIDGRTSPVGLPQVPDKEAEQGPQHGQGELNRGEPSNGQSLINGLHSKEKPFASDSTSLESVHKNAPIVWHYLTYDTPPPQATTQNRSQDGAPEPPDLSPFINPLEWSHFRKRSLVFLSCGATAITAYGAGMYAPAVDQMSAYFGESRVVTLLGITLFTAGFGKIKTSISSDDTVAD